MTINFLCSVLALVFAIVMHLPVEHDADAIDHDKEDEDLVDDRLNRLQLGRHPGPADGAVGGGARVAGVAVDVVGTSQLLILQLLLGGAVGGSLL
jgi:hypothetical protein